MSKRDVNWITSTGSPCEEQYRLAPDLLVVKILGTKPWHGRLSFDDASWAITFDGKEFKVSPRAFKIFQFICYGDGIVGSEMIRENVSMCGGTTRIGQILRDNLPDELRLLIAEISGVGGGFYLKLPQKDTAQKDTVQ